MDLLAKSSSIWKTINNRLIDRNAIGTNLMLRCENHKDNILNISNAEELDDVIKGLCLKTCVQNVIS